MGETVVLNGAEQQRLVVLNRVLVGGLTAAEAAAILDRSMRHLWRMLEAYRKEGAALAHGNRVRIPTHTVEGAVARRLMLLARTVKYDFR